MHTKSGDIAKGYTEDFSTAKAKFFLISILDPLDKKEIYLENLKAVFFVRSFRGNFLHIDSHDFSEATVSGKHIVVSFFDGELLSGSSEAVQRDETGFFLFPIDPEANTLKAFVINSFIESIDFVE